MKYQSIEVRAAHSQEAVLNHQCDLVSEMDTIAEAKRRARYYLTDEHQALVESSEPMRYAQVVADGEIIADYFRRESKKGGAS
jgi:hypothetical protein